MRVCACGAGSRNTSGPSALSTTRKSSSGGDATPPRYPRPGRPRHGPRANHDRHRPRAKVGCRALSAVAPRSCSAAVGASTRKYARVPPPIKHKTHHSPQTDSRHCQARAAAFLLCSAALCFAPRFRGHASRWPRLRIPTQLGRCLCTRTPHAAGIVAPCPSLPRRAWSVCSSCKAEQAQRIARPWLSWKRRKNARAVCLRTSRKLRSAVCVRGCGELSQVVRQSYWTLLKADD